jgi:glucokinase
MAVLGIDLGATKLAAAVFTEDGSMIADRAVLLDHRGGSDVGGLIAGTIRDSIESQKGLGDEIQAIGVCVPGISYRTRGTVWAPNIPGWRDYPLFEELQDAAGPLPLAIDSDRACSILGEVWQGSAAGCSHAIFLAVGTGIGAGILIDGEVLRGAHDIAGAIGWMALERPYRNEFTGCGNFESLASGDGIAHHARELLSHRDDYDGPLREISPGEMTSLDVFNAVDEDDPIAVEVIGRSIELWGMAVANLVSLFNPQKVIFGGGVFGPAIRYLPEIYAEAKKWAQPISIYEVELEPSSLGNHAAIFGAGLLAMKQIDAND